MEYAPTPTLPNIPPRPNSISRISDWSLGSGQVSSSTTTRLQNSAKLRRQLSRSSFDQSPSLQKGFPESRSSSCTSSVQSKESNDDRKLAWDPVNILDDDVYEEKKERLLKTSKLKKELEVYFNVETPSRLAKRQWIESDDEEYDTDLDTDIGMELVIDEKTKQIKDDGNFPEYKGLCRKYNTIPNNYFIRHSIDDELSMKHRYLSMGDCQAIGWEVENHLTFRKIDLEDNGLGPKQLMALTEMLLKNKYIQEVNLSNNHMGGIGAYLMKVILQNNSHLLSIDLSGNKFGKQGMLCCSDIIEHNVYLKELYLGRNKIEDEGATFTGKALEINVTLEVLDLQWNQITKKGAIRLAHGLKANNALKTLNLSMNGIGNEGCHAIFDMLRFNETLTSLDLSANRITDKEAEYMSRVLAYNRTLQVLKLSYNNFTADGLLTILKPYQTRMKKRLTHMEIDGMDISEELLMTIDGIKAKKKINISLRRPPSRRHRSLDPLTRCLNTLSKFMVKKEIALKDLFPKFDKEKNDVCNVYDIVELIKHSDTEVDKSSIVDLRKACKQVRNRTFLLKEFEQVYDMVKDGFVPTDETLRSPFAGKRRGVGAVDNSKANDSKKPYYKPHPPKTDKGEGVRFG